MMRVDFDMNIDTARVELRKVLYDHGIQMNKLATTAGIHENSLYRFLGGTQDISLDKWLRIIEHLPPNAREEYLVSVFRLPRLKSMSIEAKKQLFVKLASDFADVANSLKV
jgi:uncharacterized protein YaaQ